MRELNIGSQNFTKVVVMDKPGQGGACHEYRVFDGLKDGETDPVPIFASVSFQNGPIWGMGLPFKEFGINGCHQEDLLSIVIDRLQSFQENALALTKLEEAMHWLNHRTSERVKRGVEGTNKK